LFKVLDPKNIRSQNKMILKSYFFNEKTSAIFY